jgi:glycosyltransferase involved in cell wall biosynthesis
MYPFFIRRFDMCLPYGRRSAAFFAAHGGRNIVTVPHAVDNAWFRTASRRLRRQRRSWREKWGLPRDGFVFLFAGKFEANKRCMDLLMALEECIRRGLRPSLLMVGDGEQRTACETYAVRKRLPVRFAGFLNQSRMPAAYAAADCLLLASAQETWGLVVNEAMACGLPALVSDACGCTPDLILEGRTGFSFECGDIGSLAHLMSFVSASNERHRRLGRNAALHIRRYSIECAVQKMLKAVHSQADKDRR